ncbi:rhamnulokinase [Abditibacterium utsteinense]|uniref:Rhamnulokinase n=1 Tax=Abditibacterium utsteinense TaxID=1960156 RepID=A0A2S8SV75_9BACT|nr:rhamnulokinase family protein [Abditibacterium utsteinense]PQV64705.1 rhamnulokinase [Abditibacterium utsteinense]
MSELLFAAVDLGAESGRVIAGRFDGAKLTLEVAHRFPNTPTRAGDAFYWDILRLWSDICDGISKVAKMGEISGIGIDTWGVDFALLDENDALLGNPVHYRDARNHGMIDYAASMVSQTEVYARTGLQFLPFNSLFQLLSLKKADSSQLEIAKSLLFIPDLLHFWLCGVKKTEYTIASTSQMLDANARFWDEELLRRFEIPTQILCDIVPPGSILGNVREDVAARLGLQSKTPVITPGSHDTASAIVAVPWESGQNSAYLSSGTWSLMGLELDAPLISPLSQELGFTNEGGAGNTIRFLKNIAGLWLVQECRRAFTRMGNEISYADLTAMAALVSSDGSFVEPDDARFAAPLSMPDAIANYCRETNQTVPETPGEIVRCCLDSLALKYRWTFERLQEVRGERLEKLYIVGGGTQNELLCQLTADCLGIETICGPVEATAAGNILVQAMARGEIGGLDEIRAVVRNSFEFKTYVPNPTHKAVWDEKFARFLQFSR